MVINGASLTYGGKGAVPVQFTYPMKGYSPIQMVYDVGGSAANQMEGADNYHKLGRVRIYSSSDPSTLGGKICRYTAIS